MSSLISKHELEALAAHFSISSLRTAVQIAYWLIFSILLLPSLDLKDITVLRHYLRLHCQSEISPLVVST
jgi:hypothetical protein